MRLWQEDGAEVILDLLESYRQPSAGNPIGKSNIFYGVCLAEIGSGGSGSERVREIEQFNPVEHHLFFRNFCP